jgi:hypothetical protein
MPTPASQPQLPVYCVSLHIPGRGVVEYLKYDCRSGCLAASRAMQDAVREFPDAQVEKIRLSDVRQIHTGYGHAA